MKTKFVVPGFIFFILLLLTVVAYPQTQQHGIAVSWNAVVGASGYNVYTSSVAGGPYTKLTATPITTTTFFDSAAVDGKNHCYVATDISSSGGLESINSNEKCVTAFLVLPAPALTGVTAQ